MPAPLTPTQAADLIRIPMIEGAPGTTTPAALKAVLADLRVFSESINKLETNAYVAGDIEGPAHQQFRMTIQQWYDLLDYYEDQVNAAAPNDSEAVAKTVYAPLILGSCYGPPTCSEFIAASWAPGGAPMAPAVTRPFILLSMLQAAEEAEEQNKVSKAVGETIGEYAGDVAGVVKDVISSAVGAVFPEGFPKLDIPPWVWPLAGIAAAGMVYVAIKD